jgi:hypothetical protein
MGGNKICVQIFTHAVRAWWMRCRNEKRVVYVVVVVDSPVTLVRVGREHVTIAEGRRRRYSQRLPRKGVLTSVIYGRGGEATHTGGGRSAALG